MVGSVATMRVSSVMVEPSSVSGTLKSTRINNFLLVRSMSRIVSLGMKITPGEILSVYCKQLTVHRSTRITVSCLLDAVGLLLQALLDQEADQVNDAAGIAPLVVVPAQHFDALADDLGQRKIDDGRERVALVVGADQQVGVNAQNAL